MAANTTRRNVLIAAAVLGLVTSLLIYKYLQDAKARASQQSVSAVTAVRNIPPRTIIDASMVELRELTESEVPAGSFSNLSDVIGKVSLVELQRGTAVVANNIDSRGLSLGLSYVIPPSMRAVTLGVNTITGVGGFPKPGDHVDVIATFARDNSSFAKTVVQNVELLALGTRLQDDRVRSDGRKPGIASTGDTATLLVSPRQAEQLALAEDRGKLRLVLRGAGDQSVVYDSGVSMTTHTATPAAPTVRVTPQPGPQRLSMQQTPWPARPLPPMVVNTPLADDQKEIEVIRGSEKNKVQVPIRKK